MFRARTRSAATTRRCGEARAKEEEEDAEKKEEEAEEKEEEAEEEEKSEGNEEVVESADPKNRKKTTYIVSNDGKDKLELDFEYDDDQSDPDDEYVKDYVTKTYGDKATFRKK